MAYFLDTSGSGNFGFPPELDVNNSRCSLPPEVEEGNVEYKLKLVNPSPARLIQLVTQLKWRLQEGQGEAIYEIGVEDNGMLAGLTREELNMSLNTLKRMAAKLGSETTVLREQVVDGFVGEDNERVVAEVLVRKVADDQQFIDIRLAVLGNVDVGKSTLVGVLTQGELDNGRGRARLNLFRHLHEIESGRTSSISHEILGFNSKGQVVNYSDSGSAEEICEMSSKIVTFLDLAGHQKYLKTTIFGLTGHIPDFAMLVIAANAGVVGTSREHLGLCIALDVPMFIVVNKTDACTAAITEQTIKGLERVLKSPGCKKIPLRVSNSDDAVVAATYLVSNKTTPIFTVSSVTGRDLDLLKQFLNVIPPRQSQEEQEKLMQEEPEYLVDETFNVPGTGLVLGGTLMRGLIREGDVMMLGPSEHGQFYKSKVMSIRRNRVPCRHIKAGQSATLALTGVEKAYIRRKMGPFRWSNVAYDILLCKEVLARRPSSPMEWESVAETLSEIFSIAEKVVILKGRGCRERVDRLLMKYNEEDKKNLKKSGTEEEYSELHQLLEDISTYKRDIEDLKNVKIKGRERKKEKERLDKAKGTEMRNEALSGMSMLPHESDSGSENDDDLDEESALGAPAPAKKVSRKPRKRASRLSVMNMLEEKYDRKASLKEQELKQRMLEFEFEKQKFEIEAAERKERLDLELEEKRMMLSLLKDKLL